MDSVTDRWSAVEFMFGTVATIIITAHQQHENLIL